MSNVSLLWFSFVGSLNTYEHISALQARLESIVANPSERQNTLNCLSDLKRVDWPLGKKRLLLANRQLLAASVRDICSVSMFTTSSSKTTSGVRASSARLQAQVLQTFVSFTSVNVMFDQFPTKLGGSYAGLLSDLVDHVDACAIATKADKNKLAQRVWEDYEQKAGVYFLLDHYLKTLPLNLANLLNMLSSTLATDAEQGGRSSLDKAIGLLSSRQVNSFVVPTTDKAVSQVLV